MTAKQVLSEPHDRYIDVLNASAKVRSLWLGMLPSGIRYDKDIVQTSPTDPMTEFAVKLDEAECELKDAIDIYSRAIMRAYALLGYVRDADTRMIMVERYISGRSWPEIEKRHHWCARQASRICNRGLSEADPYVDKVVLQCPTETW